MTENRHQRLRRARPVLVLAAVAFLLGAVVGANRGGSPAKALADRFVAAWARGDYPAMYAEIDGPAQRATSAGEFAQAYEQALTTATATT